MFDRPGINYPSVKVKDVGSNLSEINATNPSRGTYSLNFPLHHRNPTLSLTLSCLSEQAAKLDEHSFVGRLLIGFLLCLLGFCQEFSCFSN